MTNSTQRARDGPELRGPCSGPHGAPFRGPLHAAPGPPLEAPLHTLWGGPRGGGVKAALSLLEFEMKTENSKSSENISSKF